MDSVNKEYFEKNGFLILENAIPYNLIDEYLDVFSKNLVKDKNGNLRGWQEQGNTTYIGNNSALAILCNKIIQDAFESIDKGVALHVDLPYWVSTEKQWHQDSVLRIPLAASNYLGTWVALEDVSEHAGPFEYIPGSHLWDIDFDDYYGDDEKTSFAWKKFDKLIEEIKPEIRQFVAKKGDVFLWHGRLVHRGATPEDRTLTRKSLIGHYCNQYANFELKSEVPSAQEVNREMLEVIIGTYARFGDGGYYYTDPDSIEKTEFKP